MLAKVYSANLCGIEAKLIEVEVDISNGLPHFEIVGLPDASVKESRDRVKSAIKNSEIEFPIRRIVVNLSPANVRKIGSKFDLPIALGILNCMGKLNTKRINDYVFVGELSLDGRIKAVNGVLPIINSLSKLGKYKFVIPYDNLDETMLLKENTIVGVSTIRDCISLINNEKLPDKFTNLNNVMLPLNEEINNIDFSDVYGQDLAKRAMQIAAAGRHNCLLIGSPGCGKTMLAKRIVTILPRLSVEEIIKVMELESLVSIIKRDNITSLPPFRNPHHTISTASLVGGGRIPRPGEISLAQNGVLYLDEISEFKNSTLESLRQPLEDREIAISRLDFQVKFPADFMLLASMNPCPCGYYGDLAIPCRCSEGERKNYLKKLSGPLLDRIDINIYMEPVKYNDLSSGKDGLKSAEIRKLVIKARNIQSQRYKNKNIQYNSQMTISDIKEYCILDNKSSKLMEKAFNNLHLSLRAYNKILKLARTIADFDESELIKSDHVEEAVGYRSIKL